MKKEIKETEAAKIREVAREYERKGYVVEYSPDITTGFLGGFRPDLIARSKTDTVVIEVKSRESLEGDARLSQIAEAVQAHPGWRFEVVVTNPRVEPVVGGEELPEGDVRRLLSEVETLLRNDMNTAALLTAWAVAESTLRRKLSQARRKKQKIAGLGLARTAYSLGLVSKSTYETMNKASVQRSKLAHGFLDRDTDRSSRITRDLVSAVRSMLDSMGSSTRLRDRDVTVEDLIDWFHENYEIPAQGVPYDSGEGGYQYMFGGPYDPLDELIERFPQVPMSTIESAVEQIEEKGLDWVQRGQY